MKMKLDWGTIFNGLIALGTLAIAIENWRLIKQNRELLLEVREPKLLCLVEESCRGLKIINLSAKDIVLQVAIVVMPDQIEIFERNLRKYGIENLRFEPDKYLVLKPAEDFTIDLIRLMDENFYRELEREYPVKIVTEWKKKKKRFPFNVYVLFYYPGVEGRVYMYKTTFSGKNHFPEKAKILPVKNV
jgi:hypothetical protein